MIYINGIAQISPQQPDAAVRRETFLTEVRRCRTNMLQCVEPDYAAYFHVNALRRMGRVLKLGWAAAKNCLDDAGLVRPDVICVGTGRGCYKDTQKFMFSVDENNEQFVPPSPFIQSAHSSIAAQIAIQTGCKSYNMTYTHRAFSFESALLDAMMHLKEDQQKKVLLGGVDEISENMFKSFERIGHYKSPDTDSLGLLSSTTPGTIAGEGSVFFLVGSRPAEKSYAAIRAMDTFSETRSGEEVKSRIEIFLREAGLAITDLDLVVQGLNGDAAFDRIYHELMQSVFAGLPQAGYKHLCGEYHTSTAFALWLSALVLHHRAVPRVIRLNPLPVQRFENVLIYNHYRNENHSLILVSAPVSR